MSATYKVFHVNYQWHGSYGAHEELDVVVVAENADKAIGMVAQKYPKTASDKRLWDATEIEIHCEGVHHIQGCFN